MKRILLLLILILLLAPPAAAQISAEVGETWIRWEWPEEYGSGTIILVDGVNQSTADGRQYYYLSDLIWKYREKYRLKKKRKREEKQRLKNQQEEKADIS